MMYHNPVLLQESLEGLNIISDGVYVDATFGGGGHSRALLNVLGDKARLYAFDQDRDAVSNTIDDSRFELITANFRYMTRHLGFRGVKKIDGLIADFGVSSHQIDSPGRGFSTRFDSDLDMRMNRENSLLAMDILNTYDLEALRKIFRCYGEVKNANKLASMIVSMREAYPFRTTKALIDCVKQLLKPNDKVFKVLAQVFQALRIEVNDELASIRDLFMQMPGLIKYCGRMCIISYHSLEDRLVKRFIREGQFEGQAEKDIYGNVSVPFEKVGKLIVPSQEEIDINPRSRSAKLRIAQRKDV